MAPPKSETRCITEGCRRMKAKGHQLCMAHLWDEDADTSPGPRTGRKPGKYGRTAGGTVTAKQSPPFPAKYPGTCRICWEPFPVDEPISMLTGKGPAHTKCLEPEAKT